ncbi:uncharacterized protein [Erythrolamprus reginae]|uniref:uncharacterized protein n=1 Tax=Erythrolamprus reginae TaxID=121349 RepID=UPI00396C477E
MHHHINVITFAHSLDNLGPPEGVLCQGKGTPGRFPIAGQGLAEEAETEVTSPNVAALDATLALLNGWCSKETESPVGGHPGLRQVRWGAPWKRSGEMGGAAGLCGDPAREEKAGEEETEEAGFAPGSPRARSCLRRGREAGRPLQLPPSRPCTVEIRDLEGNNNPSNPPQRSIPWRIPWEDQSQDTTEEKQRMKLSGFYDGDQATVQPPNQESPVSFKEVAVSFSEEEWSLLDPDQKALHSEVMLENHRNVVCLGHNGQENQDSCELFQLINDKDGMERFGIGMEFESPERSQSKNCNHESSSSTDAPVQDILA